MEKYHPKLDEKGDRSVDKVKARLCIDERETSIDPMTSSLRRLVFHLYLQLRRLLQLRDVLL